jgi:PAS domain S-box-containing protein
MMATPLRLLILEDQPSDTELILHVLRQADFVPDWQQVDNEADYQAHLNASLELILADYTLPQFDAMRALYLLQDRGLDIPFIIVTGSMSEEVAVECMKQGAADYILKDRLRRLGPAVMRALAEKRLRDDKQHAEAALLDSEARYRQLAEWAPDGILIHCQGTVVFVNPAGAALLGAKHPDALMGASIFDFIPLTHHALVRARIQQVHDIGYAELTEMPFIRRDGELIDVEITGGATTYQDQPAIQVIFRDITVRKELEAQLRQMQKMEAIGTLAGGIAHDFNNVLSALMGYTELACLEVSKDSTTWQHLQEVLMGGQRAKKLIQQILAFSRQTEQERKPVQLSLVVKEVLSLLRASLPSTIEIRPQITTVADTIWADPTQIHQVLMNLSTNAAHAMRDTGGVLNVRLDAIEVDAAFAALHPELRPGPHIRLAVRDTGHGMTPEIRQRIFDPFFTTKQRHEGTGLGLAVAHGIVAGHHGAITVEGRLGQGSIFTIYLPRVEKAIEAAAPLRATMPGGSEHVLFIDDEVMLARLGQEILERLGYTVTVYTNSVEALAAFRSAPQRFDLVITDQTMPDMIGETLARALRHLRPDLPIILCTGFSHSMTKEKAQAIGLDAFLMKPLVISDLALVIRQVLDRGRSL